MVDIYYVAASGSFTSSLVINKANNEGKDYFTEIKTRTDSMSDAELEFEAKNNPSSVAREGYQRALDERKKSK